MNIAILVIYITTERLHIDFDSIFFSTLYVLDIPSRYTTKSNFLLNFFICVSKSFGRGRLCWMFFAKMNKMPGVYFRYVDEAFTFFKTEADCDIFLKRLSGLHPALQFTFEKEGSSSLPFLNVLIEKSGTGFLTSVYRKPTFLDLYTRCSLFRQKQSKINLIKTLTHRALVLCSKSKLNSELDQLKKIFLENGYPEEAFWLK